LPLMIKAVEALNLNWVIAGAPSQEIQFYREVCGRQDLPILFGKTYELLEISDAALVTSGTATLETALFNVPEVVCYKGSWISYRIAKSLIKIDYISLVNLVMNREVVTELIQGDFELDRLKAELQACIKPETRGNLLAEYIDLKKKLGGPGASKRAAQEVFEFANA
jgi:lipid-A-disaccharide synthase